jgi:hypothetical protein
MLPINQGRIVIPTAILGLIVWSPGVSQEPPKASSLPKEFFWRSSPPLVAPKPVAGDPKHAIKDPSVVHYDGRWHLFCTARGRQRSHVIVYLNFRDWSAADQAEHHLLPIHPGFFAAPQVFYFRPQGKWYLICQASDDRWTPKYQPAYATSRDLADPKAWSALAPMFGRQPQQITAWLDFWVICDAEHAYLFFTSLDGKMWRCRTRLEDFPTGWSDPVVALQGDIFEASHTYRIKGHDLYLTIVEAQNGHGWRYYKAYTATRLDGPWEPLAATRDHAFASMANVVHPTERWTDVISHGELLRAGHDERLEIDPHHLRFVFQGNLTREREGKAYGELPWRLGLLEQIPRQPR